MKFQGQTGKISYEQRINNLKSRVYFEKKKRF